MNEFPFDTRYGVRATSSSLDAIRNDLAMPRPELDGKIPTLNQQGFQTPEGDAFSDYWVCQTKYYADLGLPSVDVGAAYGILSIKALITGGIIVANDIAEQHLVLLRQQVPPKLRSNLYLNNKRFPNELDFLPQSIGSIILRRVMHFSSPREIMDGLCKIYSWLVPGGTITIITMSPYHYSLKSFLPEYEKRWNEGNLWPGEICNMHHYNPDQANNIPQYLHVWDERPIGRALLEVGFSIESQGLFGFPRSIDKDTKQNGYFGIRAIKPVTVDTT